MTELFQKLTIVHCTLSKISIKDKKERRMRDVVSKKQGKIFSETLNKGT